MYYDESAAKGIVKYFDRISNSYFIKKIILLLCSLQLVKAAKSETWLGFPSAVRFFKFSLKIK